MARWTPTIIEGGLSGEPDLKSAYGRHADVVFQGGIAPVNAGNPVSLSGVHIDDTTGKLVTRDQFFFKNDL